MGYRPNPLVAVHMQSMKKQRRFGRLATIGYLLFEKPVSGLHRRYLDGAKERAEALGYNFDAIDCHSQPSITGPRLDRILKARGIQSIIPPPSRRDQPEFELDWDSYSAVVIGVTHERLPHNRVIHDPYMAIRTIIGKARDLGYLIY